jgi:hypothetical protein
VGVPGSLKSRFEILDPESTGSLDRRQLEGACGKYLQQATLALTLSLTLIGNQLSLWGRRLSFLLPFMHALLLAFSHALSRCVVYDVKSSLPPSCHGGVDI